MKNIRLLTLICAALYLFTFVVGAVDFTPSVERKDAPEIVGETVNVDPEDKLIVTPFSKFVEAAHEIHEEIKTIFEEVEEELKENTYEELIPEFEEVWEEVTGGAPVEHAVVSDIFDVRLESTISKDEPKKDKEVTFSVKIQGLTKDDKFILIGRPDGAKDWIVIKQYNKAAAALSKYAQAATLSASVSGNGFSFMNTETTAAPQTDANIQYTMGEDGVLTITTDTACVFAVVRDNEAPPAVEAGAPQSPQTAANAWFLPAIAGAVIFAAVAFVAARKLTKRNAA